MKPPLPRILGDVPRTLHAKLEIAKAICTLVGPAEHELARQRRAEIAAIRRDFEALTRDIPKAFAEAAALAKAELRAALTKYSPDQPRVPRGHPDGGEWTRTEGETLSSASQNPAPRHVPERHSSSRVRYASLENLPDISLTDGPIGTHYAASSESDESGRREENFEVSPAQSIRSEAAQNRLNELMARVGKIDPNWLPRPGVYANAEGQISTLEAQVEEAEEFLARARELGFARDLVTGRRIKWPPDMQTGDPLIDRATEQLKELFGKVLKQIGPRPHDVEPGEYGSRVHKELADQLRAGAVPGIRPNDAERTFSRTEDKFYGAKDSVRVDAVLPRDDDSIAAFYDFKTGRGMSEIQVIRIRYMSYSGRAVPVIELSATRGAIRKRR